MLTAIVLGLPKSHADRVRGQLAHAASAWRDSWAVRFQPPTGANNQIRQADIRAALLAAQQLEGSVHVLAITNQGGDSKKVVASEFVPLFRFRWLPGNWLALPYPSPAEFITSVNTILQDEEDWCMRVQPKDVGAALLLPATAFTTKLSDVWDLAAKFGDGNSTATERRVGQFSQQHWKPHSSGHHARKSLWTDGDQRVFDHTQDRHGVAPVERRWKYSFKIPDGFHYDVRHVHGRKFVATGSRRNVSVPANGVVNLDPHGHFRDDA